MSLSPSPKSQTMIAVDEETQRLDSCSLPLTSEYGCTMMEDFTIPLEYNTELNSYCAETQEIHYSEEDERTVVLGEDGDDVGISDADGASSLVVDEHTNQREECEGEDATLKDCNGSADVNRCSGSGKRSFADFRVASFRATISSPGHKMSHKYTNPENSSPIRFEESYREKVVNRIQSSLENKKDDKIHFNSGDNTQKVSRKMTARKLFDEQPSDEEKDASANETISNVGEDLPGTFTTLDFENSIAGLSYVNSQQPSDFSQSNALKAVETYLSLNDLGLSQNGGLGNPDGLKVHSVSSFNGIKLLAKTSSKSRSEDHIRGTDAFDWFDAGEDESGGAFFNKMKDSIFVDQANPKKTRKHPPKSSHIVPRKNGHPLDSGICKKDTVHPSLSKTKGSFSDSRIEILAGSSKPQIDAQPVIIQQMDAEKVDSGMDHTDDVGPDTQMAVEAMEALAFVPCTEEINKKTSTCVEDINIFNQNRTTKKRSVRHASQQKIVCPVSDFEGSLRRSKRSKSSTARFKNGSNLIPSRVSDCSNEGAVTMIGEEPIDKKAKNAEEEKKKIVKSYTTIKKKIGQKKGETGICEMKNDRTCFNDVKISLKKECLHIKDKSTQVRQTRQTRENRSLKNPDALFDNNSGKIKYFENGHTIKAKGRTFDLNVIESKMQETALNHFEIDEGLKHDACKTYSGLEVTTTWQPKRRRTNLTLNCTKNSSATINPTKSTVKSTYMPQGNAELGSSQKEHIQPSETPYSSSINKINALPPVCTSVEPHQIPKSKRLSRSSVTRELSRLEFKVEISASALKDTRKRKDISMICPLFSRHLGDDIIKQQKKILARFRITIVSSISDATHFITNKFVRTKNMLEAMALGKPVVTHLWLESCGQAGCYIDEKNYILRDFKAEKDAGFVMPVSLARAFRSPLLQNKHIFITPNVKPDRNTVSSLVKASGGQPLERTIRTIRLDKNVPGDFFVISCEEDYRVCIPLLKKGAEIFSSELLLNGIVIQKLQYERHRLFSNRS